LKDGESYSILGHWLRIKQRFDGVRSYNDSLYIPVRLRTGVDKAGVIDGAVASCYGMTPCQPLIRSSTPMCPERRGSVASSPRVGRRDDERSKGASTTSHAAIR